MGYVEQEKGVTNIVSLLNGVLHRIEKAARQSGRDPRDITLVAVSKGQRNIQEALHAGITLFGENRVSEAMRKFPEGMRKSGLSLHLIGSLQTNKVKKAVGLFDLIHSIDSIYLAEKVALEAARMSIVQQVLVQVNVAQEATKRGVSMADAPSLIEKVREYGSLRLLGLMTIPPLSTPDAARPHYAKLRRLGESFGLNRFSMGMSNDFEAAIAEGATWVRIGTAIFGPRADMTDEGVG